MTHLSAVCGINDYMQSTTTNNLLDKNITSYCASKTDGLTSAKNFMEDVVHVSHLFLKKEITVKSLDEYRTQHINYRSDIPILANKDYLTEDKRRWAYTGTEENIYCARFPHLDYCGCKIPCSLILDKISPVEVLDGVYCGSIECAYKTKELLFLHIGYILNVSCIAYNKRKDFKYFDIFINDNHTENAIKFFKITNRFIQEALDNGCKILIHSENGKSRCWVFLMAYLIGRLGYKFNDAYELVRDKFGPAEPNDNFLTQLKHYDLEVNI